MEVEDVKDKIIDLLSRYEAIRGTLLELLSRNEAIRGKLKAREARLDKLVEELAQVKEQLRA